MGWRCCYSDLLKAMERGFQHLFRPALRPIQASVQYVLGLLPRRKVAGMRTLSPSFAEVKEGLSLDINNPSGPVQVSNLPITTKRPFGK